jgi:hypothetical protein
MCVDDSQSPSVKRKCPHCGQVMRPSRIAYYNNDIDEYWMIVDLVNDCLDEHVSEHDIERLSTCLCDSFQDCFYEGLDESYDIRFDKQPSEWLIDCVEECLQECLKVFIRTRFERAVKLLIEDGGSHYFRVADKDDISPIRIVPCTAFEEYVSSMLSGMEWECPK